MSKLLKSHITVKKVLLFLVLAFGITWSIWIPILLSGAEGFSPVITLGAWGPSLAAFIILYRKSGKPGLKQLLKKVTIWRVPSYWYAVALALPAAIAAGTLTIVNLFQPDLSLGMIESALPGGSLLSLPVIFLVNVFLGGPLAEEFGWRGYFVPTVQARLAPLTTGLFVGIIWVTWHAPLFALGSQSSVVGGIPFLWYLPLISGFSVIFVYLYNGTDGSVLLCVLFHASINTFISMISLANISQYVFAVAVVLTWMSVAILALATRTKFQKSFIASVEKESLHAKRI